MSNNSPAREGAKTALLVLAAIVAFVLVVGGIVFGGWKAGWWFRSQDTTLTTNMIRHSTSAQNSYVDAVENHLSTIAGIDTQLTDPNATADQKSALQAQKDAIVTQTCTIARKVDPSEMQSDIAQFLQNDCQ